MARALKPPSDPSLATTIWVNTSNLLLCAADLRQEPLLRNERRDHRAADHGRQQDRVLLLIDDVVGKPVKRRDRSERETRRHQERRVDAVAGLEPEYARERQDAEEFGQHLEPEEQGDQGRAAEEHRS